MPEDWKDTRGLRECDCDPEYWWGEARRQREDLAKMYQAGVSRPNVVNTAHACIERALKALIAQSGEFSSQDMKHGLYALAKKAGALTELPKERARFLKLASDAHNASTYPDSTSEYLPEWYTSKEKYEQFVLQAVLTCDELFRIGRARTDGDEGDDDDDGTERR